MAKQGRPKISESELEQRKSLKKEYTELRERLRVSPSELAEITGLSVATIRQLPAFTRTDLYPNETVVQRMRDALAKRAADDLAWASAPSRR